MSVGIATGVSLDRYSKILILGWVGIRGDFKLCVGRAEKPKFQ